MTKLHVLRPSLPTGPVTRAECREWQFQCNLTGCRFNLRHSDERRDKGGTPTAPVPLATIARFRSCALNIADTPPDDPPDGTPKRLRESVRFANGMRSQESIAALLGITPQAVHHIEARALRKLAQATAAQRAYRESEGIADRQGASLPSSLEE